MVPDFPTIENATANWPVQECTREALEHAASTHLVCPLPAFDEDHTPLDPGEYQKKLRGAIVQVHFALMHYFIKQEKKSVFTAVIREIVVLRSPPAAPVNPLKRGWLADGPVMARPNATKRTRDVSTATYCCPKTDIWRSTALIDVVVEF